MRHFREQRISVQKKFTKDKADRRKKNIDARREAKINPKAAKVGSSYAVNGITCPSSTYTEAEAEEASWIRGGSEQEGPWQARRRESTGRQVRL